MVVFTCGHCGESVNKPKVEKHYMTKCRNKPHNLSCMDCFKDFLGNDYEAHTKCITEEERYSGKGFVAKEKKGEKKQNVWVEMLQEVLEQQKSAPANVRRIIETVSKHNNTPRKKPKFINFVKNVCGQKTNPNDINQAWDMISVKLGELSAMNARPNQNQQNKKSEDDESNEIIENGVTENGKTEDHEENDDDVGAQNEEKVGETKEKHGKKSKKQRKEEKKRQKYEAELQSAGQELGEEEEEPQPTKKEKKKKNRSESVSNGDAEELKEEDNKNKKRKRQDTISAVQEVKDAAENGINEAEMPASRVTQKKKKTKSTGESEEADESICLHDQNVAKIGELDIRTDKFNWHAVIMSVLEKKGEMQFKRLQKKVLGEYQEATGQDIDDRIADKFIKKLKSAPNVRVDKNRVVLVD
ncbi:cell growth-regulating nucleolar protein [Cydia strobilella]|uniref:cell growth-regulating nucleolar protein n=1 Tax=Cydia strobilella TaxID=1100964 RepID=UPI0030056069